MATKAKDLSLIAGISSSDGEKLTTSRLELSAGATSQPQLLFSDTGTDSYGDPVALNLHSDGTKIRLYTDATYESEIGVGTISNMWFKSYGDAQGEGKIEFYTGGVSDIGKAVTIYGTGNLDVHRGTISNPSIWINDGTNYNSYNENIRLFDPPVGPTVIAFGATGTSGTPRNSILSYDDETNAFQFRVGNTRKLRINSTESRFEDAVYSPAFRSTDGDFTPAEANFRNVLSANSSRSTYFDGVSGTTVSTWYGIGNKPFAAIDSSQVENLQFWTNNSFGAWNKRIVIDDVNIKALNQVEINYPGGDNNSPLIINTTASASFNHSIQCINPNLTSQECNLILLGTAKNAKNAGYLSYRHSSSGSNDNTMTIGFWNADHQYKFRADGAFLKDNQPIISGRMGSAMTNPFADQLLTFNEFWVSRGITFNASTRRFTVPVAGVYRITLNPFFNTSSSAARVFIGVNTDTPGGTSSYGHAYRESATYDTGCLNSVVSLQANDFIVFRLAAGSLYNQSTDKFNDFSIELIG